MPEPWLSAPPDVSEMPIAPAGARQGRGKSDYTAVT